MSSLFTRTAARLSAGILAFAIGIPAQAQVQAGPGAWSGNQTWAADTVNGGNLTGYFYWPATQPVLAGKRALVLVLHGCAQTAAGDVINGGSDGGFNWKGAADQYGAVILAPNATGNVYGSHCWDYASTRHNRSTGHDGVLLDLVRRFTADARYAIDPNQVYVAGLSSGGGETMALACLAPDVFAGAGINAGPPPGTTTAQISYVPAGFTAATAAGNCRTLAGSNAASFSTQIASVIWGTGDYTVSQQYGPMDALALRQVYGGSFTQGSAFAVPTGGNGIPFTDANGKLRTTEIAVSGMGHAWPAGSGGQGTNFVDATHVNYPSYLMAFWTTNNLRAAGSPGSPGSPGLQPPAGLAVTATTTASVALAWNAADGATGYFVYRNGSRVNASPVTATNFTDTGLVANTGYSYRVSSNGSAGESALSDAVTATTTASGWTCSATTASNYAHVQAGRAHASGGYALANGSNQNMGLNNTFYTSTLAQTASGYYVIGSCP
ncbi:PHB depolymerase family esterase [Massilia sp. YIM B02763]|uniref:extracellular catalytic domain type 1 short-chain-length polyhydroxyalkanoate depolymerase n=1 Tax=Massilia sp. YIM B02763 TaxID=3050130 RepID=UPI0025B6ADCA|nr:PHB depolymerase family esterase [Massilia sp. YIM B02763]MDN4053596.1 PHB depolymerase family esterase [Massilia sp. YIM B02763]